MPSTGLDLFFNVGDLEKSERTLEDVEVRLPDSRRRNSVRYVFPFP